MGLSVIIPVHNSVRYLKECVNSVLNQGIEDVEIILVENGSSDNTPDMCQKILLKDERIKYLEIKDIGVSFARNEGIRRASKEWITFLDSDDILLPEFTKFYQLMHHQCCDVAISGFSTTFSETDISINVSDIEPILMFKSVLQYAKYESILPTELPLDVFSIWSSCAKLYRANFLKHNDIFFSGKIKYSEDTLFCAEVFFMAHTVKYCTLRTYYYRPNPCSVTHVKNKCLLENNIELIHKLDCFLEKNNCVCDEAYSFYAVKIIEGLITNGTCKAYNVKKDPILIKAIQRSKLFHIIPGKRNSIKYASILFALKIWISI